MNGKGKFYSTHENYPIHYFHITMFRICVASGQQCVIVNGQQCVIVNGQQCVIVNGQQCLIVNGQQCVIVNGQQGDITVDVCEVS